MDKQKETNENRETRSLSTIKIVIYYKHVGTSVLEYTHKRYASSFQEYRGFFFFDNSKQNINFAKKKLSKLTATAFALYNHDYNHGQC